MARHQGPNYRPSFRLFLDFDPEGPINVNCHSPGASLSSSDIGENRGLASSMGRLLCFPASLGIGIELGSGNSVNFIVVAAETAVMANGLHTENGKQEGATLDPLLGSV